jgi:predicted nucleic acid-binding protein
MTHLLDTSAVLAHFLDEPGSEQVAELLAGGPEVAALAAPSWAELDRRLRDIIRDEFECRRFLLHYTRDLCSFIPLDEKAVLAAIEIQRASPTRVPLVDTLIAGCAISRGLTLVHRDQHMDEIPSDRLTSLRLPDKLRK